MKTFYFVLLISLCLTSLAQKYTIFSEREGVKEQPVFNIYQEQSGSIIFQGNKGINRWDGKSWSFFNFKNPAMGKKYPKEFPDILSNKNGYVLIQVNDTGSIELNSLVGYDTKIDNEGNLWFHDWLSQKMLYKIVGKEWVPVVDFPKSSSIAIGETFGKDDARMFIDSKNNIWIPTSKGLFMYDSNKLISFGETSNLPIRGNCTFMEDLTGNIWISSKHTGIYKYDGIKWEQYNSANAGIVNNHICSTIIDKNGKVWAAHYKGGVSFFDGNKWVKEELGENYYAPGLNGISAGDIIIGLADGSDWDKFPSQIIADNLNNIWYAATGGGLFKYDGAKWEQIQKVSPNSSIEMIIDSKGNIWFTNYANIGSQPAEGLFKFDIKNNTWNSILKKNIHNLFEDKSGSIWCTSRINGPISEEEIYYFKNN